MFPFLGFISELFVLGSSIFLIISGISTKEKYSGNQYLKKSILVIGIGVLLLTIITGIPDMQQEFMDGYHSN